MYTFRFQTCIKAKQLNTAFEKYEEMKESGIRGDSVTFQTLIKGCLQFHKYDYGLKVLEDATKNGIPFFTH